MRVNLQDLGTGKVACELQLCELWLKALTEQGCHTCFTGFGAHGYSCATTRAGQAAKISSEKSIPA